MSDTRGATRVLINGRFVSQRTTGVQRVAREVVRAIDDLAGEGCWPGVEFRLAVPETPDAAHEALGLRNVAVEVVPGGSGHLWEQRALARAAKGARLLCLGNTAPLAPLMAGRPTAVMIHDLAYKLFPSDYSRAYRMAHAVCDSVILRRARPLVTVSETERGTIARSTGLSRDILVASNGSCAGDRFPEMSPREPGGPLLYVGAFTERKNIEVVVEVATRLALGRGARTVLVGPPNDVSARLEAGLPEAARGLVTFVGYVDDDELARLYRTATALLYVSRYEASGLPPSEAMAYGLPVIASDLPVLRERCGDAALYCGVDDVDAIACTASMLLDDADLRDAYAVLGRQRALMFTWRSQARTIVDDLLSQADRAAA